MLPRKGLFIAQIYEIFANAMSSSAIFFSQTFARLKNNI